MQKKKAQLNLGDAPTVVLLVGLTFLVMATIALIGDKYGNALDTEDQTITITNETTFANRTADTIAAINYEGFSSASIVRAYNATSGGLLNSTQVLLSASGVVSNGTNTEYGSILITYTYVGTLESVSSNVTTDLNTEISNNTSIAGIILTISLVGIVLTVLIGVFLGIRGTKI